MEAARTAHISVIPERKRLRFPTIAVALSGGDMAARAEVLATEFSFFEFRLDTAPDPYEAVFEMGAVLQRHPQLRVIATCRRTENGGSFHGTAADEIEMLRQAVAVGVHIVDLSLETAEETRINPYALAPLRRGHHLLLLSWHDFSGTPELPPVLGRMRSIGADLYKIVPTATRLRDSFALLDLLEQERAAGDLVAMSMGMAGVPTRVLGPRYGSAFTFASAAAGAETAPGQVDAFTLRDLYRVEHITPQTAVYGVFGKPVGGSRSPVMMNTAFRETGQDAVYLPLETDDAEELFETWDRLHLQGASVTMPLKERILPRVHCLEKQAASLGAANTLNREADGRVRGSNTDVRGILAPLERRIDLKGASALVLGAGGVARAAVFALMQRGCSVFLANRTKERAETLAAEMGATVLDPASIFGRSFDIILNGTPYGMRSVNMEPPIDFAQTRCRLFFDLVYNPVETPLLVAARAATIEVIPGVEMFLAQGVAQFEQWTGQTAPAEAMRQAVDASLLA